MINYRKIVVLPFLLISLCVNQAFTQNTSSLIRFGLIADVQYGDCDTHGNRYYRNSLKKLEACVTDFNNQKVQFTIALGDFADRNPADLDPVVAGLTKLKTGVYNTTGNHDYKGFTNNEALYKKLNMPAAYYSFKKKGWRFIMLNTNEIASYSNIKGTWKENELAVMLKQIKAANRNNAHDWNGGISSKQIQWLKKTLETAQKKGEKVLIFSHNPCYPATEFTALNDQEILNTIAAFSCVKGLISGHHHAGAFAAYKGIPCITTEGMVETEGENAYGIVDIYADRITLTGYGRTKSYELSIR